MDYQLLFSFLVVFWPALALAGPYFLYTMWPMDVQVGDVYKNHSDGSYFTIDRKGTVCDGHSAGLGYEGSSLSPSRFSRVSGVVQLTQVMPRRSMRYGLQKRNFERISRGSATAKDAVMVAKSALRSIDLANEENLLTKSRLRQAAERGALAS